MRIAGVNIVAVLVAAVAIYLVGFLIFGVIVDPARWMASAGITPEQAAAVGTSRMAYSVVMPLMTAGFMAVLFNWANVTGLANGAKWGAMIALASAIPALLYGWVYGVGDCFGPMLDSTHMLVGHIIAGGILAAWK